MHRDTCLEVSPILILCKYVYLTLLVWIFTIPNLCLHDCKLCACQIPNFVRDISRRDLHKSNVMAHHWSTKAKLCGKGSERMVFYLRTTLFRNKRFELNEMYQQNASKFSFQKWMRTWSWNNCYSFGTGMKL